MAIYETLLVEREEQTAIVIINRSSKMNALNKQVLHELGDCLARLQADDQIRGIILTGSGEKAFVAGADIQEFVGKSAEEATDLARIGHDAVMNVIANFPKPIIAAINGYALGGGLELAMACHIRIAAEQAQMGLPEVSLGIIPGYGGTQRLPQLVGRGKALEMIMTGDMITAADALQWGLVNYVVESSALLAKAKELLRRTYSRSSTAIAAAIGAVQAGLRDSDTGFEKEIIAFGEAFQSVDAKEGVEAFLQKRKPNF